MNTIQINTSQPKRYLQSKIKKRGGKFRSVGNAWVLPDTAADRALAEKIQRLTSPPIHKERLSNVVTVFIEMLNALKQRRYRVVEIGDRIVIESDL